MNFDLFSKRNNPVRHEIYKFDELPTQLRVQILHIWNSCLGNYNENSSQLIERAYKDMSNIICREHGLLNLVDSFRRNSAYNQCQSFLLDEKDVLKVLDIIEVSMKVSQAIHETATNTAIRQAGIKQSSSDAIDELNLRFKENGIGYEFLGNQLFKKDSEYTYQEATIPALILLNEEGFKGAEEEFLNAHKLYKEGQNKEAITEALKSFESTMKTICSKKNWELVGRQKNAAALINTLFSNNLIPAHFQTHINSLKTTLEGLATLRNNHSGHGQGESSVKAPDYLTQYALNLCGTNILFLINAYKEIK